MSAGKSRQVKRIQGQWLAVALFASLVASFPAHGQIGLDGQPSRRIQVEAIRGAIQEFTFRSGIRGLDLDQLRFPSGALPNSCPQFEVLTSSRSLAENSTVFRVRCSDPRTGLPFLVATHSDSENRQLKPMRIAKDAAMVRAGQKAIVEVSEGPVAASRLVICLEDGHLGQDIRVSEPGHAGVFRARVVGAGQLRAVSPGEE